MPRFRNTLIVILANSLH